MTHSFFTILQKNSYMAFPGLKPGLMPPGGETINRIIHIVTEHIGISIDKLRARRKYRELVEGRMILTYILRKRSSLSLSAIGDLLNKRDHTTVIHMLKQADNYIATQPGFRSLLLEIENKF